MVNITITKSELAISRISDQDSLVLFTPLFRLKLSTLKDSWPSNKSVKFVATPSAAFSTGHSIQSKAPPELQVCALLLIHEGSDGFALQSTAPADTDGVPPPALKPDSQAVKSVPL